MLDCYDEAGNMFARIENNVIFLMAGQFIGGWIWGRHMFTYTGEHMGFWQDGWMRDRDGHAVGWTGDSTGVGPDAPEQQSAVPKPMSPPPAKRPRRGPIPPMPAMSDQWALASGRSFFACFIDDDGDPRPIGDGEAAWTRQRDRLLASHELEKAEPEPEPEDAPAEVPAPVATTNDPDALEALNSAISAYRAQLEAGDNEALALARVDLHAAAEKFAILSGDTLS